MKNTNTANQGAARALSPALYHNYTPSSYYPDAYAWSDRTSDGYADQTGYRWQAYRRY